MASLLIFALLAVHINVRPITSSGSTTGTIFLGLYEFYCDIEIVCIYLDKSSD